MSLKSETNEIDGIMERLFDNLSFVISSQTGTDGADLRRQIGRVRADYIELLANGGFAIALLACFRQAQLSNVRLASLGYVRQRLFEEQTVGEIAKSVVQAAIMFCLATESRMIVAMEFTSRDDVEVMMARVKAAFEVARDLAADAIDSASYQALTSMGGALINHLATAARPLPRMMSFNVAKSFPALALSNCIYYEASRAEELVLENRVVHPLFMPRTIRGLSA